MPAVSLSSEQRDGYAVVAIRGVLDMTSRDQFDRYLARTRREHDLVVLDMSAVEFMDTSCLAVIAGHWKKLVQAGGTLALAHVRYSAAKTLWITGLAHRLPLYDTVDEAVAGAPVER